MQDWMYILSEAGAEIGLRNIIQVERKSLKLIFELK